MRHWKQKACVLLGVCFLSATSLSSFAQEVPKASATKAAGLTVVERAPEEELILEVILNEKMSLAEAMLGYANQGSVLVPLTELLNELNFPIQVNPILGTADGWFVTENRRFSLDLARREVVIDGVKSTVPKDKAELHDGEIYVDISLFSKWFPIDVVYSVSAQQLLLTSREKLPIELAEEREKLRSKQRTYERPQYERFNAPDKRLSIPTMDINYGVTYDSEDKGSEVSTDVDTLTRSEVFGFNSSVFLSASDDEGVSDVKMRLERKDPDGKAFGDKVPVTEFSLGDIYTPSVSLLTSTQDGRGGQISNFPLERAGEFNRTTIRGDILPNWEIEIYRNDVLLEFQRAADDGKYEFQDVPLVAGLNIIRLVFYGPFGEKREEIRRFMIGPDLIKPGQFYYSVAANQHDRDIISVNEDFATIRDDPRVVSEFQYGLTDKSSLYAHAVSVPLEDDNQHSYVGGGLAATIKGVYSKIGATADVEEGNAALEAALQSTFMGVNISLGHEEYLDGFISERTESLSDPRIRRSLAGIDRSFSVQKDWLSSLNLGAGYERNEFESGRVQDEVSNRISAFVRRVSLSNTLTYNFTDVKNGGEDDTRLRGEFLMGSILGPWALRGQATYNLDPITELDTIAATADYSWSETLGLRAGFSHQLTNEGLTIYNAGVNKQLESMYLSLNSFYQDDGEVEVRFSVSSSIGYDPAEQGIRLYQEQIADNGLLLAKVYLDKNANGVFDGDDEPIEGALLRVDRGLTDQETNKEGLVFMKDLTSYRPIAVSLDRSSLDDPYLLPEVDGREVVLRPGVSQEIQFAVVPTGEIDGTVYVHKDGQLKPASNVDMELVDEKGVVVATVHTAYDGFYLFELVRPGTYNLRVSPAQMAKLDLVASEARQNLQISGQNNLISGLDFAVQNMQEIEQNQLLPPQERPASEFEEQNTLQNY